MIPAGYSGQSAITQIRLRTNENSLPTDANILTFLNAGIEQVEGRVGGIRLYSTFPTTAGMTTVTLTPDVQDIITASWSTGDPTRPGSIVYPMEQREQAMFMDTAAGFPAVGFGPPQAYFLYQDFGTGPTGVLPAPSARQVTVTGGTSAGYTTFVATTLLNPSGETTISPPQELVVLPTQVGQVASPIPYANATGYNVYAGASINGPFYLQNATPGVPGDAGFTLPSTLLTTTPAPSTNTATYISGGSISMQLYPAAMVGQVNLYYRARPMLWADATVNSNTNLDTLAQEAVILWTVCRVLENRQRGNEVPPFNAQLTEVLQVIQEKMQKRSAPKSGRVRDVTGRSFPTTPGAGTWG